MMYVDTKHISDNRHSWNVRRVEELQVEIALKEKELRETEGFFARSKVRSEIQKDGKTPDQTRRRSFKIRIQSQK